MVLNKDATILAIAMILEYLFVVVLVATLILASMTYRESKIKI